VCVCVCVCVCACTCACLCVHTLHKDKHRYTGYPCRHLAYNL